VPASFANRYREDSYPTSGGWVRMTISRGPSVRPSTMILVFGVAIIVLGGALAWFLLVPSSSSSGSTGPSSVPSGTPTVSNCFGGGLCNSTSPGSDGSGTTCTVSGFSETPGDLLYVAVSFNNGSDLITSVSDNGTDSFSFLAGEFAYEQGVAFYDTPAAHGGTVSITVTISETEYGVCTVGELTAGTKVGEIGPGASTAASMFLGASDDVSHAPSLILALFGATRPTGTPTVVQIPGDALAPTWGGDWVGYTYAGAAQMLCAGNVSEPGTASFNFQVGNTQTPSITAIAVDFYLPG